MYAFFSKLGYKKRACEWLPLLLVRLCLGVFFILSGFFKLFDLHQHEALLRSFTEVGLPFPEVNVMLLPIIEIIAGGCILVGFLTSFASFILFILVVGALVIDRITPVTIHGEVRSIEHFLYLPEVLYALMLFWLFFSGPGKISFDFSYGKKKQISTY
ncbi:MAG: hypothetical protein K1060chlam2_00691 [Chlamydiae bacterium]|nr:hypothetical protein [Chlamydiota bacterium]